MQPPFGVTDEAESAIRQLTAPGQPYEMMTIAPAGTPVRTWARGPGTLREIVEGSRQFGTSPFLVCGGERWSFGDHYGAVSALAHHLQDIGIGPGDRVAIAMRNRPEWSIAFWATVSIGAIAVPLNAWWTGSELAIALGDSGASVLIADAERAQRLTGKTPTEFQHLIVAGNQSHQDHAAPLGPILARRDRAGLPPAAIRPDDDATIFYTSGTTRAPKGVLGTHRNMASCLLSRRFFTDLARLVGHGGAQSDAKAVSLLTVPLFHVTGSHAYLLPALATGTTLVLMPKWDVTAAIECIARERVTAMGGVPFMALQLLDTARAGTHDLSSLERVTVGGSPMPPGLIERLTTELPTVEPGNGYGMTETSSVALYNLGQELRQHPQSLGRVVPVMDAMVVDETGNEVDDGTIGELLLRGPNVMRGYWNRPQETAEATAAGGWLRTGDLVARAANGLIDLVGRKKEHIIRGGENVAPAEVEAALLTHPAVADAAVVGIADPLLGETVAALVRVHDGHDVDTSDLRGHLATHLARFKVPDLIRLTDEPLPRNAQGKIVRTAVRTRLED